jgi:hypothetical protein
LLREFIDGLKALPTQQEFRRAIELANLYEGLARAATLALDKQGRRDRVDPGLSEDERQRAVASVVNAITDLQELSERSVHLDILNKARASGWLGPGDEGTYFAKMLSGIGGDILAQTTATVAKIKSLT